ncbi:hypothetical protein [Cyclobacterium qasimii]|uniref:Uncharacterized protein n=2 Tax=Cyclobacterium qasimii TaxID=1350429 RepID=S7X149_9BACT|nr:hypothetical protein [Cyclobacterium qasimii]EPR69873.1 hypothetical protein ADICYQ_1207 [Cyclobacterium qasimii M12-11B]GEO23971.1 hypothetical protein CQA01_45050 [Cyclobacterium qasimii]
MLNPEHIEKVDELLKEFKAFQEKFEELKEDEFTFKKTLINLIADHFLARKRLKTFEAILYLDSN